MNREFAPVCFFALFLGIAWVSPSLASEQSVLHWEVNAALGLSGGPTPEQLATGKPATFSEDELQVL